MTIQDIKDLFIPKNTRVNRNNYADSQSGLQLYNDAINLYDAIELVGGSSGGVIDGDKGDITVSSSGTVWNINPNSVGTAEISNNSVDNTKVSDMPPNTVKVRKAGTGDPEDMPLLNGELVGRTSGGNIAPIKLGTNLTLSGDTINAVGGAVANNGITGAGTISDPNQLGGTLVENTVIDGNSFNLNLLNLGTVQLESDATSRSHRTELVLAGNNTIGAYLRHINKSNPDQLAQLSLDHDSEMGFSYQIIPGQGLGFFINPGVDTNNSSVEVKTKKIALGTAVTGQVLTLQSDGTIDFDTPSTSGTSSIIQSISSASLEYQVLTGTPVITYIKASGVGTMSVTGGTIKLLKFADIISDSEKDGNNDFKWLLVGTGTTSNFARPSVTKYTLNASELTSDASSNATISNQVDIDNTPQVKYGNISTTGQGSITIRSNNIPSGNAGGNGYTFKW